MRALALLLLAGLVLAGPAAAARRLNDDESAPETSNRHTDRSWGSGNQGEGPAGPPLERIQGVWARKCVLSLSPQPPCCAPISAGFGTYFLGQTDGPFAGLSAYQWEQSQHTVGEDHGTL